MNAARLVIALVRAYLPVWIIVFSPLILVAAVAGAAEWLWQRVRARRDIDQAVSLVCRACVPGKAAMGQRCTCTSRCGHLDCIGDHTALFPVIREDQ